MPLIGLDPVPDFAAIARASRAHGITVTTAELLAQALDEAIAVIRTERRAVVVDVATRLAGT